MTPYLQDGDLTLHHGDAATVLADLPEGSVDCVVTSPPYFGLRDYGTATWEGGDGRPCLHGYDRDLRRQAGRQSGVDGGTPGSLRDKPAVVTSCPSCGAVRHDVQIGLEPTPEEYVAALVGVFRQVWRVLAPWGTCFVNIGDSYAGNSITGRWDDTRETPGGRGGSFNGGPRAAFARSGKPKDLLMMPARLALALQADGWWVRSRIVWAKPNPMPESVTDRPTSAHEDVYLLTKAPRYYYDAEAVREPALQPLGIPKLTGSQAKADAGGFTTNGHGPSTLGTNQGAAGRNLRNVWSIATEPTPEAHFATFPTELVRRCLAAGCPARVCRECGEPSRRIVETPAFPRDATEHRGRSEWADGSGRHDGDITRSGQEFNRWRSEHPITTTGWTDCGCLTGGPLVADLERAGVRMSAFDDHWRPGIVLDPFVGSGTTALVARRLGLHAVGIDASAEYLGIAAKRLQQLSLLGGAA